MSQLVTPSFSARVSPEMVALMLGASPQGSQSTPDIAPLPGDIGADGSKGGWQDVIEPVAEPSWRPVRLRRDGMFPLCLEALPVAESASAADVACGGQIYAVRQQIKVFLTRSGTIVMQMILEPPDDSPARPVYRACLVETAEDCAASLENTSAALCFAPSAQPAHVHAGSLVLPLAPQPHSISLN